MNPKFRKPLLTVSSLALLAAFGAGMQRMSPAVATEPATQAKPVLTVNVASPTAHDWDTRLAASGGLFAWQEAIVAAELGGLAITELGVDVGSVVKRGQVLARLSQDALKASLAAQQANVARARAALAEATANADRARKIKDSGALSEQQIQQFLLAEDSAKAGLAAAEAAQHADEVRLRQTAILAADHGVISARNATLGSVVQPGAELFRLVRQGRIEWRAEMTAEQLAQLRVGQKAQIRLPDGKSVDGKLRMLAPTLDNSSRKALAYFDLSGGSSARAGMFAQGEILLGKSRALAVPHAAVLLRDGNAYVFEIDQDNRVQQRKVRTGRRSGDGVEIVSGIAENARIVVSGGAFLNQGDTVRLATATEAKPAGNEKTAAK